MRDTSAIILVHLDIFQNFVNRLLESELGRQEMIRLLLLQAEGLPTLAQQLQLNNTLTSLISQLLSQEDSRKALIDHLVDQFELTTETNQAPPSDTEAVTTTTETTIIANVLVADETDPEPEPDTSKDPPNNVNLSAFIEAIKSKNLSTNFAQAIKEIDPVFALALKNAL